jgi:GTP-binding protein HflX
VLPRPAARVHVLLPYTRGDLVARIHDSGEVLDEEHTGEGTEMHARVPRWLAEELSAYAVATADCPPEALSESPASGHAGSLPARSP